MTARHDGKQPMHPASTGQDHSALHPRPSSAQADSSDRSTSAPNATGVQRDALAENFVYYNDAKVNFRVCPLALEYEEAFRLPPRTAKALIDAVDIIGARLPLGSKNAFEWKDHKGESTSCHASHKA